MNLINFLWSLEASGYYNSPSDVSEQELLEHLEQSQNRWAK
ncbi:hypothetical protein [Okeania hirsuta]|nr:hypothetical protein [Okeania hirsuta]